MLACRCNFSLFRGITEARARRTCVLVRSKNISRLLTLRLNSGADTPIVLRHSTRLPSLPILFSSYRQTFLYPDVSPPPHNHVFFPIFYIKIILAVERLSRSKLIFFFFVFGVEIDASRWVGCVALLHSRGSAKP